MVDECLTSSCCSHQLPMLPLQYAHRIGGGKKWHVSRRNWTSSTAGSSQPTSSAWPARSRCRCRAAPSTAARSALSGSVSCLAMSSGGPSTGRSQWNKRRAEHGDDREDDAQRRPEERERHTRDVQAPAGQDALYQRDQDGGGTLVQVGQVAQPRHTVAIRAGPRRSVARRPRAPATGT